MLHITMQSEAILAPLLACHNVDLKLMIALLVCEICFNMLTKFIARCQLLQCPDVAVLCYLQAWVMPRQHIRLCILLCCVGSQELCRCWSQNHACCRLQQRGSMLQLLWICSGIGPAEEYILQYKILYTSRCQTSIDAQHLHLPDMNSFLILCLCVITLHLCSCKAVM